MSIGSFNQRAVIQTRSGSTDAHGHVVPTWTTAATRWCRLQDQSGRELFRAQQVDPIISAVVTLREQYSGLTPKDRLVIEYPTGNTRTFAIKAVLGSSDRTPKQGQALACTEEV